MLAFIEYLAVDLPPLISSASAAFLSLSVPDRVQPPRASRRLGKPRGEKRTKRVKDEGTTVKIRSRLSTFLFRQTGLRE